MSLDKAIIEHALRRLPEERLHALKLFTVSERLSSANLSMASGATENALGGKTSSIIRTKIQGQPIVKPSGRDSGGYMIMQLNTDVVDQRTLAEVLREIGVK